VAPAAVTGFSGILQVAAGTLSTCALREGPSALNVFCWGFNRFGALGTGDNFDHHVPTLNAAPGTVALEVGDQAACSRDREGAMFCWGHNPAGVVGDGTWTDAIRPVRVNGPTKVADLDLQNQACARNELGLVHCWGENGFGQVGNGGIDDVNTPTRVVGY
jgi:hypothetical protein